MFDIENVLRNFCIFLVLIVLFSVTLAAYLWYKNYLDRKYKKYIDENSIAIKNLKSINLKYSFNPVFNYDLIHEYDNEAYYNQISPKDYLTYNLVTQSDNVKPLIKAANYNREIFARYNQEIQNNCVLDTYEHKVPLKNLNRLRALEQEKFNSMLQRPNLNFSIRVDLYLTKINGYKLTCKSYCFNENEIIEIISKLKQKNNGRYVVDDIWDSICRVERGKVSNKLRFAIYERDGYCCRSCGSSANLEVDHILPISKGGKSNVDNLQTLCHTCNYFKSDFTQFSKKLDSESKKCRRFCPICGANLVLRDGEQEAFYGCSNFPNCKYTRSL